MYPNTALQLHESKKNVLKDFVNIAGVYGVTHMMILTKTEKSNFLRLIKNPQGPTITFKVNQYTLSGDIVAFNQEHKKHAKIFAW